MFKKITKIYLESEVKQQMSEFFDEENFIQLNNFFEKDIDKIKSKLNYSKFDLKYNPMKYKFKELDLKNIYDLEIIELVEFFKSKEFLEYIEEITQIDLSFKDLNLRKYLQSDFTLLHDNQEKEDIIEVIFDLSDNWKEEFGGILTYLTKDEEIFYLSPIFNSLTILYKPEYLIKYLKYINNKSKGKNIIRFEIKFDIED